MKTITFDETKWRLVPVELASRVQDSLGRFTSDEGFGQEDVDTADDFDAALGKCDGHRGEEIETLRKRIDDLEDSEAQLMEERDSAEAALTDMFQRVTGREALWSNWWGKEDAVEEAEEHVEALREDAERYRWIRTEAARFKGLDDAGALMVSVTYRERRSDGDGFTGLLITPRDHDFDAAIDAAMDGGGE